MRWDLIAGVALLGGVAVAQAQVSYPPSTQTPPDLSQYATKSDVASAASTASTALATAQAAATPASVNAAVAASTPNLAPYALKTDLTPVTALASAAATPASVAAAITAATPPPCSAPLPDTLTGTAGVASPCMTRPDATRPTQVQRLTVTTNADGTFSGTWPAAFSATPVTYWAVADAVSANSAPFHCSFIANTVTTTAFTGKCWQVVASTLPTTINAVLGLTVSPLQNAAAGITVRVTGRQ